MKVIDHHDDLCEAFLVKNASAASSEIFKKAEWREKAELLDRDVALILVEENGAEHRKFACFDEGNILMSEWYLLNANHSLSSSAIKTAATNLVDAADEFGIALNPATSYLSRLPEDPKETIDERRVAAGGRKFSRDADSIKTASAYDALALAIRNWDDLDPYDKRDISVDLVGLSKVAGMDIPDHIYQYSGEGLSTNFKKVASYRKNYTADTKLQEGYDRLSKMANSMSEYEVVEALYLLDEQAGLTNRYGENLPNPVLSVFGTTKEAEYSWIHGGDYVTEKMLKRYSGSTSAVNAADNIFTDDVKEKFRKDPVGLFKSLPLEQQILLARLASQSRETNDGGY